MESSRDYEALILLARVVFTAIGVGSILCGWIVFFVTPILFVLSLLAIINGMTMLMYAVRARRYMPRDKFDKEFRS